MKTIYLLVVLSFISLNILHAQDTLVSNDNTVLIGEIKEMDKGVLSVETDFSDSDFKITWLKIKEIKSQRTFRIILSDQKRYYGTIFMKGDHVIIHDQEKGDIEVPIKDIVYIKHVDEGNILDVINLSLDLGYSFTNANNLSQLNGNLNGDYYTNRWGINGYFSTVQSTQKEVEPIRRNNGGVGVKVFAKYGLFGNINADYFSNTEQNMRLRSTYSVSLGKYFVRTNKIYFNTSVGSAYLLENYSDTLPDRKSFEGRIGLEYNMFDVGDLNLFSKLDFFPSFTEKGRIRTLFNFTLKYDLPRDFYIKASLNYNYDNKPAEDVNPNDYVYTLGFGWEL